MAKRALAVTAACAGLLSLAVAGTSDRASDLARVRAATAIFQQIFNGPGRRIPATVLPNSQCVAIIPGYKDFGIVGIGGNYGKGVAMCRNKGTWSAPIFIAIGGASLGPQLGLESANLIMIFRTRAGLERMLNNKLRIGAAAGVAAGPVGRYASASTDATMEAQVVSYAHSHGLFAGVDLNGAIVQPDETGNRALYPHQYWQDVLDGKLATPSGARRLVSELDRSPYTNPAVMASLRRRAAAAGEPAGRAAGLAQPLPIGPGGLAPLPFSAAVGFNHISGAIGLGGWNFTAGWRPWPVRASNVALIADFGRGTGSQALLGLSTSSAEWTLLAGPQLDLPMRLFDPYGHLLFGVGHLGTTTSIPGASVGFSSFAWELGGGVRLNVARQFSIRLFELDFLHTSFNNNGGFDGRVSFGVAYHF